MDYFLEFMSVIIDLFQRPFTIWGYTFSLWSVAIFVLLAGLVGYLLDRII